MTQEEAEARAAQAISLVGSLPHINDYKKNHLYNAIIDSIYWSSDPHKIMDAIDEHDLTDEGDNYLLDMVMEELDELEQWIVANGFTKSVKRI